MTKKEFKLPPLSPLIGSNLSNYIRVTRKKDMDSEFRVKYILTGIIIGVLSPFRWYESWYFRNLKKVKIERPLFILGHWRSGTTHLHNLLCQPPEAGFVTTYQTVFSNYLASQKLLKPFMSFLMPDKRPSDNVKLNVEYPQEEEFALSNMTYASYYHFFYFPKLVKDYFDRFIAFKDGSKDLQNFKKTYHRLLQLSQAQMKGSKYQVIKNPVNTGRYDLLKEMYPDAGFIHIYRNPYIVFLSTKKFFYELMPTLWFHKVDELEIEEMILDTYVKIYDLMYGSKASLEDVYELPFEKFEKDPLQYLEDIYKNLALPGFEQAEPYFRKYQESQKSYRKNKYSISRREFDLVTNRWSDYIKRWNYDLPDNLEIID